MQAQFPGSNHWHPRLLKAALALHDDRLDVAERLLKPHLKDDPYDVRAIRMLAELAARIGRMRDAETLLRRAVEIAPAFTAARANLALVLSRMGRAAEAMELLEAVFEAEPEAIGHLNLKAATLGRLGDFDEAIRIYETVLERGRAQPRVWLSYGHMLKTVGRQADGVAAYRQAISLRPTLGEAWWSLANLKTVRFDVADVQTMRSALSTAELSEEDRFHLEFALGKAMHDLGRSDEAFGHYERGNSLRRERRPFDSSKLRRTVDRCLELFTSGFLTSVGGSEAADPIFIVGLPRAGSTLIEQILSSHPLVEGTSELPDMPVVAREQGPYPAAAVGMSAVQRQAAAQSYLQRASVQRKTDRPFFIDKLPNNWLFVPFIHSILPNAKIIDARRHPLGCCMSNFRQHFARGQDFTYDLGDLGRYYSDYLRLMSHVDAVLPGRVHRIIYERMVQDTEAEVRSLLAYCGLEFDEACLAFHETERPVRTASSEQVRQPIYTGAKDEWQLYERHLQPLRAALGPLLGAYPEVPASLLQR